MKTIGFPISRKENERRRAIVPCDLARLTARHQFVFEAGYGQPLGYSDDDYRACGATVGNIRDISECSVICNPKPLPTDPYMSAGKTVFGWIHAVQGTEITQMLVDNRMTAIAWEEMYENRRYCFESNREIAGEAAIAHACLLWGRAMYDCQIAIIGNGMTARGVLRALGGTGRNVVVYDENTSPYLREELHKYDVIVNCVLWDVSRQDHIIYEEDLARMKTGSLIVDVSCDEHMAIESSRPTTIEDPVYWHKGILHYAVDHTPSLLFQTATKCISESVAKYLDCLATEHASPVLAAATIIRDGRILDDRIIRFQKRQG